MELENRGGGMAVDGGSTRPRWVQVGVGASHKAAEATRTLADEAAKAILAWISCIRLLVLNICLCHTKYIICVNILSLRYPFLRKDIFKKMV